MTVEYASWTAAPAVSFHGIKNAIGKNLFAVCASIFIPVALTCLYLFITPPIYQASTEILIDPRGLQVVQNDVTPRTDNNESSVSVVESQLRVVQSEAVLRAVVDRLHLETDPEFIGRSNWLDEIRSLFSVSSPEDPRTTALRSLQKLMVAQRASRSYVIVIKARSEDPIKAARIADAVAAAYLNHEIKGRSETARRVEAALESRLKELADRLNKSEQEVERFRKQNNLVGTGKRLVNDQQLEELNTRLGAARAQTSVQRARLDQVEAILKRGADPDAIPEAVLQSTAVANLRSQYAEIVRSEGTASVLYGPLHPTVKIIREQRARYRTLITDELRRIADSTRNEYARAKANEDALTTQLETLKQKVVASDQLSVRLRELERLATSNRAIYEAYLVRGKEIGEQGAIDTSNTRVIAAALAPNRPASPRGSLILLSLIVGFAIAASVVWVKSRGSAARSAS